MPIGGASGGGGIGPYVQYGGTCSAGAAPGGATGMATGGGAGLVDVTMDAGASGSGETGGDVWAAASRLGGDVPLGTTCVIRRDSDGGGGRERAWIECGEDTMRWRVVGVVGVDAPGACEADSHRDVADGVVPGDTGAESSSRICERRNAGSGSFHPGTLVSEAVRARTACLSLKAAPMGEASTASCRGDGSGCATLGASDETVGAHTGSVSCASPLEPRRRSSSWLVGIENMRGAAATRRCGDVTRVAGAALVPGSARVPCEAFTKMWGELWRGVVLGAESGGGGVFRELPWCVRSGDGGGGSHTSGLAKLCARRGRRADKADGSKGSGSSHMVSRDGARQDRSWLGGSARSGGAPSRWRVRSP